MNQPTKVIAARNQLNKFLNAHKDQLAAALPAHLTPDRMARLALTAFNQNQALAQCTPESIFASIIVSSQLGLEVGLMGHGYLVPYKGTCTFIPGWQGYVELVNRTGRATVHTGAVFEGDVFEWHLGTEPFVKHKPGGENDIKKLTHVYAIGHIKGGVAPIIEVWPMDKVYAHRDKFNKVGKSHYSFEHPEMYARKVALLQVVKYLPKSVEITNAMSVDINAAAGKLTQYIDGEYQVLEDEPSAGRKSSYSPDEHVDTQTGEVTQASPAFTQLKSQLLKTTEIAQAEQILKSELMKKASAQEREQLADHVSRHIDAINAGMVG